jgi:hypothetical protein
MGEKFSTATQSLAIIDALAGVLLAPTELN